MAQQEKLSLLQLYKTILKQAIIEHITCHIDLSEQEKALIIKSFEERHIKRKERLLNEGSPCHQLFFIASGLLRAYCINEEGKELTVMFAMKNWWITDMQNFVSQQTSTMTIEALTDSSVLIISKTALDNLFETVSGFNEFWRILMQNAYCREQTRVVQNLTLQADDRYRLFMDKYPELVEVLTQRQIASYLGVTPEFLSVIRSRHKS